MITVKLKHLRISPRKVRLVADLIRGKPVHQAEKILEFTRKKAAKPIQKLLKSGIATAENDFQKTKANLYISKITVDPGPSLKRFRHRAQGRIYSILKRTSHINLSLDEIKPTKTKISKKTKKPAQISAEIKPGKEKEKEKTREIKKPRQKLKMPKPRLRETAKKMFRRKAF